MPFARALRAAFLAGAAFLFYPQLACPQLRPPTFSTARNPAPLLHDDPACDDEEAGRFLSAFPLVAPCNNFSHAPPEDPVRLHLLALHARGLAIEQARERVIAILSAENSCSAWFRESRPHPASIFQSLEFSLEDGPKQVVASRSARGELILKHPYSAAVVENAGPRATVQLNANGPFFAKAADVLERESPRPPYFAGRRTLRVGSYEGSTLAARITTLLHELGHVIGRLPDDSDESSGLSGQNTQQVVRVCRAEIEASARPHRDKAH